MYPSPLPGKSSRGLYTSRPITPRGAAAGWISLGFTMPNQPARCIFQQSSRERAKRRLWTWAPQLSPCGAPRSALTLKPQRLGVPSRSSKGEKAVSWRGGMAIPTWLGWNPSWEIFPDVMVIMSEDPDMKTQCVPTCILQNLHIGSTLAGVSPPNFRGGCCCRA